MKGAPVGSLTLAATNEEEGAARLRRYETTTRAVAEWHEPSMVRGMADEPEILTFTFGDAGAIPNNPKLPVVIYKRAGGDQRHPDALARWFETTWPQNGWRAAWRWGVYDFPHYHSTAHEILGVYRGQASLRLGDKAGATLIVQTGDMIVLPAGTAHQNLGASADFHVVGGYPSGQDADLLRGEPGERPAADERIANVPLPHADPIGGVDGVLVKEWGLGAVQS